MQQLRLWHPYTRQEVHDVFEPDTPFTPQTGKWGLPGIVRLTASPGSFVFFVTFGSSQGDHNFVEAITDDGVLSWQSQPRQRLKAPMIQEFIRHDDLTNTIHLFLRTQKNIPYTYFGSLGYLDHDPHREAPVYFTWQLLDWPPPAAVLEAVGVVPAAPLQPIAPLSPQLGVLIETEPPVPHGGGRARGGSVEGSFARLPGQDARDQELGAAGEMLVLDAERRTLEGAGRGDLAADVVHVSVVEGDSAGYDIRSFAPDGSPRYLEVKTTRGPASNAFYISPNEIDFSQRHPEDYVLVRVYGYSDATQSANCYEMAGPVTNSFGLTPTEYRAQLLRPNNEPNDL